MNASENVYYPIDRIDDLEMKIRISRRLIVILLILLIFILAFLALSLFVGYFFNRDSRVITFPASNVDYSKWQLPEGAILRLGKGTINDIEFSPDGTQFAVATTIGVWLYDAKSGREISLLNGDRQDILDVAFYGDGKILLGVNRRATIWQWNTASDVLLSSLQDIGKRRHLYTSEFSKNGMRLAGVDIRQQNKVSLMTIDLITGPRKTSIELDSEAKISPAIALSSDGRYLATAMSEEDNYSIQVWNTDTGELLNTFSESTSMIKDLAFSLDGTFLAIGNIDETIMLWDIASNISNVIYKGTYSSSLTLTFSPDGELLASGDDDGNVRILKVNDSKDGLARVMSQDIFKSGHRRHKDKVTALTFSPDGKILISGSEDGTIGGWDVTSRKQLFISPGHSVDITGLAEIRDENNLLSMHSLESQILRWDINSGKQLTGTYFFNKHPKALSPDGMTLVIEEWFPFIDDNYLIWNIPNRRKQSSLKGHDYNLSSYPQFVFSSDGSILASTDYMNEIGDILVWNTENAKRSFLQTVFFRPKSVNLTHTLSGHIDKVNAMVFSPNGKMLASSGYDKRLCLWNIQTGENIFTKSGNSVSGDALVFSRDSKILASGRYTRVVLWDTKTGEQINSTKADGAVNILAFSPDNKILLSGIFTNGNIQLFDAQSLESLSTHKGHTADVIKLLFLSDVNSLVSASEDGTMLLWDWEKISQTENSQ